jgi:hypothetical protein
MHGLVSHEKSLLWWLRKLKMQLWAMPTYKFHMSSN